MSASTTSSTSRARMLAWLALSLLGLLVVSVFDVWLWHTLRMDPGKSLEHKFWWQLLRGAGALPPWLVLSAVVFSLDYSRAKKTELRGWRSRGTMIALTPLLAGIFAEVLKGITRRARPTGDGLYRFGWLEDVHAFGLASSHTAVAFGGAIVTGWLFPKVRIPLLLLATGTALTRLLVGAHYVSDVYVGVMCACAAFLLVRREVRRADHPDPARRGLVMSILDHLIARQFLFNTLLLFVFLFVIILSVDFSLNFDEFSGQARRELVGRGIEEPGSLRLGLLAAWYLIDLWWPRMLVMFNYLLAPVLVGAIGFTYAGMVKHRELVAMLASGISLSRAARPVLACTVLLTALMVLNREWLIPRLATKLTRTKLQGGASQLGVTRDFCSDASGRLIYTQKADLDTGRVQGFFAWERDESGLVTRRISAERAHWDNGRWVLENGRAVSRRFENEAGPGSRLNVEPVSSVQTDVDPTTLRVRRYEGLAANLSTPQINQLIRRFGLSEQTPSIRRRIDALERVRWGRVSTAACVPLTVIICLPFFLRKEPTNMLRQSLFVAPIALGAIAGTLVGTTATVPGLPAQLSVFIPVMMLVPGAILAAGSIRS